MAKKSDARDLISKHLKKEERGLRWLARKCNIPYGTMYACIVEKKFKIKSDNLQKINELLNTDFTI